MSDAALVPEVIVAGSAVVRAGDAAELVPANAEADAVYALDGWRIQPGEGDMVLVDGRPQSRHVLRDLWARLGDVLGQQDRDAHAAAWSELRAYLDREFEFAMPARGKVRRPGEEDGERAKIKKVEGVLYRWAKPGWASFRIGTYAVALLHPHPEKPEWWEGPVREYWPGSIDPQSRLTPARVRVPTETVEAAPVADPSTGRPARPMPRLEVLVGVGRPAVAPAPTGNPAPWQNPKRESTTSKPPRRKR